jgi:hypothetical protein
MMNWLFYTLPENKRSHYFICLWISLVFIPSLFPDKFSFNITQSALNFICYDILYYFLLTKGYFDR